MGVYVCVYSGAAVDREVLFVLSAVHIVETSQAKQNQYFSFVGKPFPSMLNLHRVRTVCVDSQFDDSTPVLDG
jgi:hypothetical protein